jgi:hypothetical protein
MVIVLLAILQYTVRYVRDGAEEGALVDDIKRPKSSEQRWDVEQLERGSEEVSEGVRK